MVRRHRHTTIDQRTINDDRLSFRARGVLVWLLDKPDDWRTNSESIARAGKEGRDAVRSALKELEGAGYIKRQRRQDGAGRWTTDVEVYERPDDGIPGVGEPAVGEPAVGSSGAIQELGPKTDTKAAAAETEQEAGAELPLEGASISLVAEACQLAAEQTVRGRPGIRSVRSYARPRAVDFERRHRVELLAMIERGATVDALVAYLLREEASMVMGSSTPEALRPRLPEFRQSALDETDAWRRQQPASIEDRRQRVQIARQALEATRAAEEAL